MSKAKQPKRWLRFWYEDGSFIDLDITHCINNVKDLDMSRVHETVTFITEEDIDEYDKGGN